MEYKNIGDYLHDNNLHVLFSGKTYGDTYKVAVQEIKRVENTPIWVFGRVYEIRKCNYFFDPQGCKSFQNEKDAIKEACEFFGVKSEFFIN